jgi:hypothetical protein
MADPEQIKNKLGGHSQWVSSLALTDIKPAGTHLFLCR